MTSNIVVAPPFTASFFLPKYWLTWLGVSLLYIISWLPYRIQVLLGKKLGWLLGKVAKKRVAIARRNLELCFPDMGFAAREKLLKENVENAGLALLEAGMGWWWPDWRIRNIGKVEGFELVEAILARGNGVLALTLHNMNLEIGCRIAGLKIPSVAFYRKHNNPVMEYLQYRGRARANKYMVHKKDVKGLVKAIRQKEVCFYFPDHDYGRHRSEFVPFYGVPEVATTTGTLLFAKQKKCETLFLIPRRTPEGYTVTFSTGLENFPSGDDNLDMSAMNKEIEKLVSIAPEQYLWMHKRFKTRPNPDDASLYS